LRGYQSILCYEFNSLDIITLGTTSFTANNQITDNSLTSSVTMGFANAVIDPLKGFYFNTLTVGKLSSSISSTKEISFSMNILIKSY